MQFQTNCGVRSWGRVGRRAHEVARPRFADNIRQWNASDRNARLAVGSLRSYSDVCLSDGGRIIDMTGLNRFRSFDPENGILVAEAGVTFDSILRTFVPLGFFLPVTPGTRFVTLGGAVANDVHGKNHHRAGTFGRHVCSITLERSDRGTVHADPASEAELFAATIGGLGLTGIITEVEVRLQRIGSSHLAVETVACDGLDELCAELDAGDSGFEHNVAWIDCTGSGRRLGRGLVSRANWAEDGPLEPHGSARRSVPTDRVDGLLNPVTLRIFNSLYHANGRLKAGRGVSHYEPFLYPLDSIGHWNRLYGRSGFYQYQCVIPDEPGRQPIAELLKEISSSGEGSFLAVLKRFGDISSPGMLSFPMPGLTLALDFRNRGEATLQLLSRLDDIVEAAGGRLYAAKDMRLPAAAFRAAYPMFDRFCGHVDPCCRSDFWRKLNS